MATDDLVPIAVDPAEAETGSGDFVVFSGQPADEPAAGPAAGNALHLGDLLSVSETRVRIAADDDDRAMGGHLTPAAGTDLLVTAPVAVDSIYDDLWSGHLAGTDGLI